MFRPYNLTSLAAWTVGCLAGNEAYYATRGAPRRFSFKSNSVPASVIQFNLKLGAICNEINSLTDRLRQAMLIDGKFDLTPLVHLMAFQEWFETNKETIQREARKACKDGMDGRHDLVSDEVKRVENAINSISNHLDHAVSGIQHSFFDNMPDVKEHQKLLDMLKQRQSSCRVNEGSFKLIDSDPGKFYIRSHNCPV